MATDISKIQSYFRRIARFFRALLEGGLSPAGAWHLILGCTSACVIAIAIFAYITYMWAMSETTIPTATSTSKGQKIELSRAELDQVINFYAQKQEAFTRLEHERPIAPDYHAQASKTATTTAE